jgi:hypothetical protein
MLDEYFVVYAGHLVPTWWFSSIVTNISQAILGAMFFRSIIHTSTIIPCTFCAAPEAFAKNSEFYITV